MQRRFGWAMLVMVVACALGCAATPGPPVPVRRSAAADLGCSTSELAYQRLGNGAYRISGCGQQVSYTYACPPGGCQWMRDGAPAPIAPAVGSP